MNGYQPKCGQKPIPPSSGSKVETSNKYPFCNLLGNCLVYSENLKDYNDMRKGLKSEGRKEFAERLKDMYKHNTTSITSLVTLFDNINNLLKEMEG